NFVDEPIIQQALDRAIERPRPQMHEPVGELRYLLHDGVAVGRALCENEQDVKRRRREREEVLEGGRLPGRPVHHGYIHSGYMTARPLSSVTGRRWNGQARPRRSAQDAITSAAAGPSPRLPALARRCARGRGAWSQPSRPALRRACARSWRETDARRA